MTQTATTAIVPMGVVLGIALVIVIGIGSLVRWAGDNSAQYDAQQRTTCAAAQQALARIQLTDPEDFQIVLKLYANEGCR